MEKRTLLGSVCMIAAILISVADASAANTEEGLLGSRGVTIKDFTLKPVK
jgi:hypothetical protein